MTTNGEVRSASRGLTFPRYLALALGILVVLWALGTPATRRLGGEAALPAMLIAGASAFAASLVGTLPLYLKRGAAQVDKVPAVLASTALRLLVVVVLAAAAALSGLVAKKPLLIWVAVSHAGLLVADTLFARSEMAHGPGALEKR